MNARRLLTIGALTLCLAGVSVATPAWGAAEVAPSRSTGLTTAAAVQPDSSVPGSGAFDFLLGVSCTGPTSCMAVGDSEVPDGQTTQERTLAESWNGSHWSIVPTPDPSGVDSALIAVSCTGPVSCVAVGQSGTDPETDGQSLIESWDGTTWTIVPSPNTGPDALSGVSCRSATSCVAVGTTYPLAPYDQTLVESWNGSIWSIVPSPDPGNDNWLLGVSCPTANDCVAVGGTGFGVGAGDRTLVESWNGTAWSVVPSDASGTNPVLTGVSCTDSDSCTAVGSYTDGVGDEQSLAESWNGTAWSLVPSQNPNGLQVGFSGVSCTSTASCTAVGGRGAGPSTATSMIETRTGTSFAQATGPAPTDGYLYGVSCTAATACVAVGSYGGGDGAGPGHTLVETWSGGVWSVVPSPDVTGLEPPVVAMAALPKGDGYWLVDSSGDVTAHGAARIFGSLSGQTLNAPIVRIVATPDGQGYWLVAADGGVFSFGNAVFYGSMGATRLDAPVVGMALTASGHGYWLVAGDGGVFAFGDAGFAGSMGGKPLNEPVVGIAADGGTGGYWLVAADGGVFAFNAPFRGSEGGVVLDRPVRAMASTVDGGGYWLTAADGGVFAFGDAAFHGSMGGRALSAPVVGMAADPSSGGYWLVGADGGIFSFDAPFYGAG